MFSLRPQYGQELVLFKKAPEEGVHLNAVFAGGLSLGLLKPYYIRYLNRNEEIIVAYDPEVHSINAIVGSGSFLDGFSKMELLYGFNFKAALSFELGAYNDSVVGVETGFWQKYSAKRPNWFMR